MGYARRALVPVLLAGLAGLFPTAAASPPDSVWLPGIYDSADYDDVIGLATSVDKEASDIPVAIGKNALVAEPAAAPAHDSLRVLAPLSTRRLRSPPVP